MTGEGTPPRVGPRQVWERPDGSIDWHVAAAMVQADVDRRINLAVNDGRLHPDAAGPWRDYFLTSGHDSLRRASAALAALPAGVYRSAGGTPAATSGAAGVSAGAGTPVAATDPAGSQTPATQVLPVGPANAAETAAVLGPRPGSDWFAGVQPVSAQAAVEQAQWDAKVSAAMTYEEHLAREVAFEAQRRGITEAQARAELEGVRDTGIRS